MNNLSIKHIYLLHWCILLMHMEDTATFLNHADAIVRFESNLVFNDN